MTTAATPHPRRVVMPADRRERASIRKAWRGAAIVAEALAEAEDEERRAWILANALGQLAGDARTERARVMLRCAIGIEMEAAEPAASGEQAA